MLEGIKVFEKSSRRCPLGFVKNAERGTGHEKEKKSWQRAVWIALKNERTENKKNKNEWSIRQK
jgi:hypothetical protein